MSEQKMLHTDCLLNKTKLWKNIILSYVILPFQNLLKIVSKNVTEDRLSPNKIMKFIFCNFPLSVPVFYYYFKILKLSQKCNFEIFKTVVLPSGTLTLKQSSRSSLSLGLTLSWGATTSRTPDSDPETILQQQRRKTSKRSKRHFSLIVNAEIK